jgi:hypothetical protein
MMVVTQHVPPALRGIVVAGFMAAFMSTFATQLNWGASYLVADFYRRFLKKDGTDSHYVTMPRVPTVLLVIFAAWVSAQLASIRSGWEFVLEVGAGTGGVYLLRWYWWRINAWSEISAMATALVSSVALRWWAPRGSSVVFARRADYHSDYHNRQVAGHLPDLTGTRSAARAVLRKVRPHVTGWAAIAWRRTSLPLAIWDETFCPGCWDAPWSIQRCSAEAGCFWDRAEGAWCFWLSRSGVAGHSPEISLSAACQTNGKTLENRCGIGLLLSR